MRQDDQNQLFSVAEQLAGVGHWKIDLESQYLYWSDQTYRIHELDPNSFTPTTDAAIEFYHPDDRVRVSKFVANAVVQGKDFEFDLRIITAKGKLRYVRSKAQCLKNGSGAITHVFGIFLDVTQIELERQRNEAAQRAHQTHIEASGDGYWDWYIQDDYEYMSPRFWEMFGYEPHEKPHKPSAWQDMIVPEDLEAALVNFDKHVVSKGEVPYEQEVRYWHKNGSVITVLCKGKVIEWDANGQPVRMVGTHTDISKLRATLASLKHANEELEEFAYRTSHDLRSPLISSAKLIELTQNCLDKGDTEKSKRYLTVIRDSLTKLEAMVSSILSIATLTHKEAPEFTIDLKILIDECLSKFSYLDGFECVRFEYDYQHTASFTAQLEHLRLILENLISNAIKYRDHDKEQSWVKISSRQSDDMVCIDITDNGLGVPDQYKSQIFSMFKRFHPDTSIGTGLGLYMVKKSATKIGGQIRFDSGNGETKFHLSFPIKEHNRPAA